MNFKILDGTNCNPVVLLCFHSPKQIPEMNEEQENGVTVRGRNENTATPQSAHTEFKNCMGRVTA
jgi:hypothetical protein